MEGTLEGVCKYWLIPSNPTCFSLNGLQVTAFEEMRLSISHNLTPMRFGSTFCKSSAVKII
jgi:hypothetical protein